MKTAARKADGLPPPKRTDDYDRQQPIKKGVIKFEPRKSISLERNQNGEVIALVISGKRYVIIDKHLEMPEQIAEQIALEDLDFNIAIDIEDKGANGIISQALIKIPNNEWSVTMMVRHTLDGWNKFESLSDYANQIDDAIRWRDKKYGNVICLDTHIRIDHFHITFAVKATGVTIRDLLDDARKKTGEFIPY